LTEDVYIPLLIRLSLNKSGLDLPAFFITVGASSLLCLVRGFGGLFRPSAGPVCGGERRGQVRRAGPFLLAGSGEFFCPSIAFFGDGTIVDAISGEDVGRSVYHFLEKSGGVVVLQLLGRFSPFGCSVVRCVWAAGGACGIRTQVPRRCDGRRSSSFAWAFNVSTACRCSRCATR